MVATVQRPDHDERSLKSILQETVWLKAVSLNTYTSLLIFKPDS